MKSIRATFLRPDALPGVNHMHGMQYQNKMVLNIVFCLIQLYTFVCTILTQNSNINLDGNKTIGTIGIKHHQ